MTDSPRPMTLGEILDRTVQFYRSRFLVYLGISVIPTAVILVFASGIFVFLAWWGNNGAAGASKELSGAIAAVFVGIVGLIALPLILTMTAWAEGAINHAVSRAWHDEKSTIRAAYAAVWPRGWRYIWLYVLRTLAVWGVPGAAWLALVSLAIGAERLTGGSFAMGGSASGALVGLAVFGGFAVVAAYGIWMLLELSLAFPTCVVEQITAWAAVKRSRALTKGTRGRIFLLYLLGVVLTWVLSSGILLVVTIAATLVPGAKNPQRAQTIGMIVLFVAYAAGFAVQALIKPIYGIALVLFYYDQRIRLEGFDIEWMMQRAGMVAPAATVGPAAAQIEEHQSAEPETQPATVEAAPVILAEPLADREQA